MAEDDWAEEKKLGASVTSYPDTTGSYQTGGQRSAGGTAPSYVNSQFADQGGPKGKNLKEGGFESNDRNNASFTSEIGSKNDPGRAAEASFQRVNAASGGMPPKQSGGMGDSAYEALDRDTEA